MASLWLWSCRCSRQSTVPKAGWLSDSPRLSTSAAAIRMHWRRRLWALANSAGCHRAQYPAVNVGLDFRVGSVFLNAAAAIATFGSDSWVTERSYQGSRCPLPSTASLWRCQNNRLLQGVVVLEGMRLRRRAFKCLHRWQWQTVDQPVLWLFSAKSGSQRPASWEYGLQWN